MSTGVSLSFTRRVAIGAIGLAGAVHIVIAPSHWQHAPAHGLFFLGAGIVEVLWSVALLRKPSRAVTYFGIGMASMLLMLWILARALPAPFGHGPEAVEAWGLVCKLAELVGAIALGLLASQALDEGAGRAAVARVAFWRR
jgi:hypothetical protein